MVNHMKKFYLFILLCLAISVSDAHAQCWDGTVSKVIDGNTLLVSRDNTRTKIRLYGIEAPLPGKPYGVEAAKKLSELVGNRTVTVCPKRTRNGSSSVVYVLKGFKKNVNEEMVRRGHAGSTIAKYQNLEKKARQKGLGLWADDTPVVSKDSSQNTALRYKAPTIKGNQSSNAQSSGGLSVYNVRPFREKEPENDNNTLETAAIDEKRQKELEALRAKERQKRDDTSQSYSDIDQISIQAMFLEGGYEYDSVVEVIFDYTGKNPKQPVYWADGDVNCVCSVTGHFSQGTNTRIARTSLILTSSSDRAFVDIPYRYIDDSFMELNSFTVECRLSSGMFDLKASDKVYLKFTGRPRHYDHANDY